MSDTPETDHIEDQLKSAARLSHPIIWKHARQLERERDEATRSLEKERIAINYFIERGMRERDEARAELEMWRDGNIMHEIHRDDLQKAERERDEAREQNAKLREIAERYKRQWEESRSENVEGMK